MRNNYSQFQAYCACGRTTTKKYAREHGGKCKHCAEPQPETSDRRNALLIDSGYMAYAREEGHFDIPDSY